MKFIPKALIRILWIGFISGFVFLLLLIFAVKINLFGLFGELPGLEILENPKNDEVSLLLSSDGEVLGSYYRENRTPVEFDNIPADLINALIATEDVRFENHSGIDMKGTFAIFYYVLRGKRRGSSTLSQQTAKNLFRLRDSEKYRGVLSKNLLVTKIKEWIVAIRIERAYTKQEIITMYLNTVEFGRRTFGIKSAAETYFNKEPDKLSKNECALLVGLLKGPSFYDPIRHEERALARRNTVFDQMVKANVLSQTEAKKLSKEPLELNYTPESEITGVAPYLRAYLRPFLMKWAHQNNYDLWGDGLRIYTTVDYKMQKYAEAAVRKHMKALQNQFYRQWKNLPPWKDHDFIRNLARNTQRYKDMKEQGLSEKEIFKQLSRPELITVFSWDGDKKMTMSPLDSIKYFVKFLHTGLLSLQPQTGEIKAYVGDIGYRYFKFDNVTQGRRQAGSTFKPFVYAFAIEEKGFTPCSEVLDVEVVYPWGGGNWTPENSNGKYSNAPVSLKYGLANSVNSVAANLMMQSGPNHVADFAARMGIKGRLDPVPSLALGVADVRLFDMVAAYCAFVNGGTYIKPHALLRIEDKYGNVLQEFKPETHEVISEKTAFYMVELLKAGSKIGTSRSLKTVYGIDAEIGGKTGTTQNSADGWFIGISPELVTGVWVGGQTRDIRLRGGQGATLALPIWAYYMKAVFSDTDLKVEKAGYHWAKPMPIIDCEPDSSEIRPASINVDEFIAE